MSQTKNDAFDSTTRSFFYSLSNHTTALVVGLVALVIAGVTLQFFLSKKTEKEGVAQNALFSAQSVIEKTTTELEKKQTPPPAAASAKGTKNAKPQPAQAAQASLDYAVLNVGETFAEGLAALEKVVQNYSGTRAAFQAQMQIGDLYFNHGDSKSSVASFQKAVTLGTKKSDVALAQLALGYAFENSANYTSALEAFNLAVNSFDQQPSSQAVLSDALLSKARTQELLGQVAPAKLTYDAVIKQFPNTEASRIAESQKAKL